MTARHFILATAGHVDHGKSALVKALTGTDPDRLPEEKARGITIDLGFAHLELQAAAMSNQRSAVSHQPSADGPHPSSFIPHPSFLSLGIVDVPGHEDFVKNMVAGVGSIDLALLVVAADDGWMPQTEEHLQILIHLGVTRAVVALTKMDLAQGDEAPIVDAIREKLRGTTIADAPIIGTSVLNGRGLDELKAALARVLEGAPSQPDIGKPRLPVDRVFTLRGVGTVVTGTLTGGILRRGQAVVVQPSGKTAHVRGIQSHNRDVEFIGPGTRTALSLPDLAVSVKGHSAVGDEGIHRGDVITGADFGGPNTTLGVLLKTSPRPLEGRAGAARPLKDGTLVHIHHGSGRVSARIHLLGQKELNAGQDSVALLHLDTPIFAFAGDRFIVRDWPEQRTLAGGVVLDPDADQKHVRGEMLHKFLKRRAETPDQASAFIISQLARDGTLQRSALLVKSRFSAVEISDVLAQLSKEGKAVCFGAWAADASWWQKQRRIAVEAIEEEHRVHPERTGLSLNALRQKLGSDAHSTDVFDAMVDDLCNKDFIRVGAAIRRVTHRPALPPHLQAAGARVRSALAAKPFDPPSRKELAPDAVTQQALRFLLDTGEAAEIGGEAVLLAENFARATAIIKKFLVDHRAATVSELRQAVGTSRRILVPLLERLDREGVTLRQGDRRVLRPGR